MQNASKGLEEAFRKGKNYLRFDSPKATNKVYLPTLISSLTSIILAGLQLGWCVTIRAESTIR